MFYVSEYNKRRRKYGVTDTSDGVTEFYTGDELLNNFRHVDIIGIKGKTIKVVNAAGQLVTDSFSRYEDLVRRSVAGWTEEQCLGVARSAHFVKKIKGLPDDEMRRVVVENIYPDNVREAMEMASDFSNRIYEVDCSNKVAMIQALRTGICLVLQHKTNGVLTSFMCSGNLAVLDAIYEPMFFDSVYLTKQLYGYTYNLDKVRPKREPSDKEKNPAMLNVFSCALRFRYEGTKHDGLNKELSSPFYTVNLDKVLGMYMLVEAYGVGNRIIPEFKATTRKDNYNFDFNMWKDVRSCLAGGQNYFLDKNAFMKYVDTDTLTHEVNLEDAIQRFDDDFHYMQYLRQQGYSFKV